ncbi:unnamed protein product, partial [Ascophyllum nodosum]
MRFAVLGPACLMSSRVVACCAFLHSPVTPKHASGGHVLQQLLQLKHSISAQSCPERGDVERTKGGVLAASRSGRTNEDARLEDKYPQIKTGTAGWAQRTITITAPRRGCHLITADINKQVPELGAFRVGMVNIFLKHTSASLTINENADPDVRTDMEAALNQIVPVKWHDTMFRHTMEGPDDMTGHVKSTIVGASLNIPVTNGGFALGTWQGVYLCEHRDT